MRTLFDGSRRELTAASAAAVLLVLLRCAVATAYEGFYFDSDQAIVGLMAKHLAAFHDFPLYYYGQNYMLGVQAWIIAPFFWILRPTVAAMRTPLVLLNAIVAVWLVRALARHLSLRPAVAFLVALPFILPGPAAATHLLEMGGASIEPFVYVLLLWALRRRPFAFGLLLAFGFQHREWTIFALPALVLAEAASGELWTWGSFRRAGWLALGFATTWLVLDDLKMHLSGATAALQVMQLRSGLCFDAEWRGRVAALLQQVVPPLYNGARLPPFSLGMNTTAATGHPAAAWLLAAAVGVAAARAAWGWRRLDRGAAFGLYLVAVGLFALAAYPLSCTIVFGGMPLLRYVLFGLMIPIGVGALFMQAERSRPLRLLVGAVLVVWASANLVDTTRVLAAAVRTPPPDEHRVLADYLVHNGIRYARATYWDAYVVDFLSRERVTVASSDTFRIAEYQKEVDAHAGDAITIVRQPCHGFDTVASWCLQR